MGTLKKDEPSGLCGERARTEVPVLQGSLKTFPRWAPPPASENVSRAASQGQSKAPSGP